MCKPNGDSRGAPAAALSSSKMKRWIDVFRRPAGGNPAFLEQDFLPAHVVVLTETLVLEDFSGQIPGQVVADEFAHFAAKGGLFLCVIQVHRRIPGGIDAAARLQAIARRHAGQRRISDARSPGKSRLDAGRHAAL